MQKNIQKNVIIPVLITAVYIAVEVANARIAGSFTLLRDIISLLFIFGFAVFYCRNPQFRDKNLAAKIPPLALIAAAAVLLGAFVITAFDAALERVHALLYYLLIVACGEELAFRGYLYAKLREELNFTGAIVLSGILYGLAHGMFQFVVLNQSWISIPSNIGGGIIGALIYALIFEKAGTIIVPIVIHWILDFWGYLL